jgi:predicted esterase
MSLQAPQVLRTVTVGGVILLMGFTLKSSCAQAMTEAREPELIAPCGQDRIAENGACIAEPSGKAGLVLFLHGKFSGEADVWTRTMVAERAKRKGFSVLALYGRRGFCPWEKDPPAYMCWPAEESDAAAAAEIVATWKTLVERAEQQLGVHGRRILIGYSNGAFFAATVLLRNMTPWLDAGGILLGGSKADVQASRMPSLVLVAAREDPWHFSTMAELHSKLETANWPHRYHVRSGSHALQPSDVDLVLE